MGGNMWIAIEYHSHHWASFYQYQGNLLMEFGFDAQSQTEFRVRKLKNPIWASGGHFEHDNSENQ